MSKEEEEKEEEAGVRESAQEVGPLTLKLVGHVVPNERILLKEEGDGSGRRGWKKGD